MAKENWMSADTRNTCVGLAVSHLFHWLSVIHGKKIDDICMNNYTGGFRFRGEKYTHRAHKSDYKLIHSVLPKDDHEDFLEYLEWYEAASHEENKVKWFLAKISTAAPDVCTMMKLFPEEVMGAFGNTDNYKPLSVSWSDEQIQKFKDENEEGYTLVSGVVLTETLIGNSCNI